jgi:hypothetical protein
MGKILSDLPAMLQSAFTANNAQQVLSVVPMPHGKKRATLEQGEATPPRSPPNPCHPPHFQRPESDFSAAVLSPNTERHQALARVEVRYNDRVLSLGRQPGEPNGSWRRRAIVTYPRGQMIGGSLADADADPRERAHDDMKRRCYRHLPQYTATTMPSDDPVPSSSAVHYHYHGDIGYTRPSHGPCALQASAQPRGRSSNTQFPFQGRMQMQMQNAADDAFYDDAYHYYTQ